MSVKILSRRLDVRTVCLASATFTLCLLAAGPAWSVWPQAVQGPEIGTGFQSDPVVTTDPVTATGPDGSVYLAGTFRGTATFAPGVTETSTADSFDVFVAKYTDRGDLDWVATGSGPGSETVADLQVDAAGDVYITGAFRDDVQFGAHVAEESSATDIYVAKVASRVANQPGDARFEWEFALVYATEGGPGFDATSSPVPGISRASALAIDEVNERILVGAEIQGRVRLTGSPDRCAVVPAGALLAANALDGSSPLEIRDTPGGLGIVQTILGQATSFCANPPTSESVFSALTARDGAVYGVWEGQSNSLLRRYTGLTLAWSIDAVQAGDIQVDDQLGIYLSSRRQTGSDYVYKYRDQITGAAFEWQTDSTLEDVFRHTNQITLSTDGSELFVVGTTDANRARIATIDSAGDPGNGTTTFTVLATTNGGNARGRVIAADASGRLYVAGVLNGTVGFGAESLSPDPGNPRAFFLAQLDTAGNWTTVADLVVGQPITPPLGAAAGEAPTPEIFGVADPDSYFYWDESQYFPLRAAPTVALLWKRDGGGPDLEQLGAVEWPAAPQRHMAGADVDLTSSAGFAFQALHYSDDGESDIDATETFRRSVTGFSTLRFDGPGGAGDTALEVVETVRFDGLGAPSEPAVDIGTEILLPGHSRTDNAFLVTPRAPVDAHGIEPAFNPAARTGQIIPVNVNGLSFDQQLAVVGYTANAKGVRWPDDPYLYHPSWPAAPFQIVIKDEKGSETGGQPVLVPSTFVDPRIYAQGDPAAPGFNPNDEHAILAPSNNGTPHLAVFALREQTTTASDPYVLLKYRDPLDDLRFKMTVYQVTASGIGDFSFDIVAGGLVPAPYPLVLLGDCTQTFAVDTSGSPFFQDVRGGVHARANGVMEVTYFYPLGSSFYYDPDLTGGDTGAPGQCVQFVDQPVEYRVDWPPAPTLFAGETLIEPKRFMPDILNQAAVEVAFQGSDTGIDHVNPSVPETDPTAIVKLFDALSPRFVDVPSTFPVEVIDQAPFYLKVRLEHDPLSVPNRLAFQGFYDASVVGEDPVLLLNVMSEDEYDLLLGLSTDGDWRDAMDDLFDLTRDPVNRSGTLAIGQPAPGDTLPRLLGAQGVLSAGAATATGYVTLAFNNDLALDPAALPISLEVIRVDCDATGGFYQGTVHTMPSDNVFDERLTLRHSGDFGGDPERFTFDWHFRLDEDGPPNNLPPGMGWAPLPEESTEVDVTITGANERTISDTWLLTRYADTGGPAICAQSAFTGDPASTPAVPAPKLAEGWIKRVLRGLDPFRARTAAFHAAPTATYATMIEQAGEPFAGPVAWNGDPANVNQLGLIETYESVLRRGTALSIDAGINRPSANTALLLAAGRIADLTMLLGNEAWADAQDPTIGFGTQGGDYGSLAPSIFAFQNQLPNLLDEELALLRGRDDSNAAINLFPVFNRLIWNIETGDIGEAAYSQVYNLRDRDLDGFIDTADARIQYPQGHGDAWGYYTSALDGYYRLLRHPDYEWIPRAESVNVAGTAVPVDYRDERKFAAAAAARARAGAEIASLSYRKDYVEDPAGQWQGYKDPDEQRAWGLSGWARRAGHGALFDWVTANALLPAEWQAPGARPCPFDDDLVSFVDGECVDEALVAGGYPEIGQIDRGAVPELAEVTVRFGEVQAVLDQADAGRNPLGLARGVVPFDIDPTFLDVGSGIQGQTHFEQIEDRARKALESAVTVFDHANQLTQSLRRNQDTLTDFARNVDDRERDLRNRLIEIFGYPFADDIGAGGTYPAGYDDADIYHYMVVEPSELIGEPPGPTETVTVVYTALEGLGFTPDPGDGIVAETITVDYAVDRDGIGIVKPASWSGTRKAPGEAQRALSEYYQAVNLLEQAIEAHDRLLGDIDGALELLEAQNDLRAAEIDALSTDRIERLNARMLRLRRAQLGLRRIGETSKDLADALVEGLPEGADDFSFPLRGQVAATGVAIDATFQTSADITEGQELEAQLALDEANARTELTLATARNDFEVVQRLEAVEQLVRSEPGLLLEIYNRREIVRQSLGNYQQVVADGLRLIDELVVLRRRAAADVQQHRYQDLTFRVARNDALQKYRAQLDLAARYVYLAASAYDYETNLLGSAGGAGRDFLTDIVRHRSLGQVVDGVPQAGSRGLADPLARLGLNFDVLEGQLGFNNPQTETTRFSLRSELLRIDDQSDGDWQRELTAWRVDNLWNLPQFRRFARPFAPEPSGPCTATDRAGCEPALVIGFEGNGGQPVSTGVVAGLNYFGHELGAGDSAYDATNFATRIRTVGVWLTGYEGASLSATPSVYVLPVGQDVLRSPTAGDFTARRWSVVDQALPVPFPIGATSLDDPLFIPINDSLSGVSGRLGDVRRLSSFRAFPDTGAFEPSQTTTNSRLIGRSVANTRWLIIIPGRTLLADPDEGLDRFIQNVDDIKLFFQTYAYSGN